MVAFGQDDVLNKTGAESKVANDIVKILPATGKGGLPGVGKPCFPNTGDLFGTLNTSDHTTLDTARNAIFMNP